jgi:hypothetical protein
MGLGQSASCWGHTQVSNSPCSTDNSTREGVPTDWIWKILDIGLLTAKRPPFLYLKKLAAGPAEDYELLDVVAHLRGRCLRACRAAWATCKVPIGWPLTLSHAKERL